MRKVFAILVSLCIGLVCGFIVPSGISEGIDSDKFILSGNDETNLDEKKLGTIVPGFVVIPDGAVKNKKLNYKKVRKIDDKALYEHSQDKENNLNERSYIYINQKFKASNRNTYDLLKEYENNPPMKKMFTPAIETEEMDPVKRVPNTMSFGFFQPSLNEMILNKEISDNYILTNTECDDCIKVKKVQESLHERKQKIYKSNNIFDDQLNYLELLKPPFVRPINTNNVRYNYPNTKDFSAAVVVNPNHYNDKKYFNSESPPVVMQKELMKNLETYRPHQTLEKSGPANSQIIYNDDKIFFDRKVDTGVTYRPLQESADERRELERLQKNTYGEKVVNEKVVVNYDDCNYKDCVQTNKKYQRKANKSKCKCPADGTRKGNNNHRGRLSKEDVKMNKARNSIKPKNQRQLEYIDYDNTLVENASRAIGDELMKSVNSLNFTLQMYP